MGTGECLIFVHQEAFISPVELLFGTGVMLEVRPFAAVGSGKWHGSDIFCRHIGWMPSRR